MRSNINPVDKRLACLALFCAAISTARPAGATNVDLFNTLVTGGRSNFSGTIGFTFTADANFTISELGRAVNPTAAYSATHLVQLWDAATQTEAERRDRGPDLVGRRGVAVQHGAPLGAVHIVSGGQYALTTLETSGGPDLWGDTQSVHGKYDSSLITITSANYSPGTSGYPSNVNGTGEDSYGVPTFFVAVAPEPSSFILAGLSAVGLFFAARRRRGVLRG